MYTEEKYSITDLSKILKVTDHTLRYYEKEFDLLVPRDSRGRRYYTKDLINVFKNIKNQRNKGIEIRLIKKNAARNIFRLYL
jgi:DNA-binding transcriptional MerR regulator